MDLTLAQVGHALTQLEHYRVVRAQAVAKAHAPPGVDGALVIALGLRETGLRNIEGGAKLQNGHWVKQDDPALMDVGAFQINRSYHRAELTRMPGVRTGTWTPVVTGRNAAEGGFVPRYEEQLQFVITELATAVSFARDHGVTPAARARFAVAAHNAGLGGALTGYRAGNVDQHTALGNYSAWCLGHADLVRLWLLEHPGWAPA